MYVFQLVFYWPDGFYGRYPHYAFKEHQAAPDCFNVEQSAFLAAWPSESM